MMKRVSEGHSSLFQLVEGVHNAYCVCLNVTINDFHGDRIHRYATRAVYEPIRHDGLGVDSWKRLWSVTRKNRSPRIRHLDLNEFINCKVLNHELGTEAEWDWVFQPFSIHRKVWQQSLPYLVYNNMVPHIFQSHGNPPTYYLQSRGKARNFYEWRHPLAYNLTI